MMIKRDNIHMKGVVKTGGDRGSGHPSRFRNAGDENPTDPNTERRQYEGDYHYIASPHNFSGCTWGVEYDDLDFNLSRMRHVN